MGYTYIALDTPLSVTDETGATTAYDRLKSKKFVMTDDAMIMECEAGRDNGGIWEAAPYSRRLVVRITDQPLLTPPGTDYTDIMALTNPVGVDESIPAAIVHVFQFLIDTRFPGTIQEA